MKFHNLRSLIHRPYLCVPCLRRNDPGSVALVQEYRDRVYELEETCISEARLTAHLLHNIEDKETLVHDFPWWQMIPCLICASSILLVARACAERFPESVGQQWNSKDYLEVLDEDAGTCYKVFDALSNSSEAAKLARNMIERLRKTGMQPQRTLLFVSSYFTAHRSDFGILATGARFAAVQQHQAIPDPVPPVGTLTTDSYQPLHLDDFPGGLTADPLFWNDQFDIAANPLWPCEISDAMLWSSQFLEAS